jgi:predicted DNA-binding transcriptional regulator AlpA
MLYSIKPIRLRCSSTSNSDRFRFVALDLVTTGQIGDALGVSRQWVDKIIRQADDFPEPEIVMPNAARLWRRGPALRWFEQHPRRTYRRSD